MPERTVKTKRRMTAELRKRVILDAALRLFAERGSAGMTTAVLAKRSGVTEPILYRHFPSKKKLIEAIIDESLAAVGGALLRAAREVPAEKALENVCRRFPDIVRELGHISKVVPRALAEHPAGPVHATLRVHYEAFEELIAGLIAAGQKAGTVRRGFSPSAGAWHFLHAAIGYQLAEGLGARGQRAKAYDSLTAELLLSGIR